jgi:hypothetical protein
MSISSHCHPPYRLLCMVATRFLLKGRHVFGLLRRRGRRNQSSRVSKSWGEIVAYTAQAQGERSSHTSACLHNSLSGRVLMPRDVRKFNTLDQKGRRKRNGWNLRTLRAEARPKPLARERVDLAAYLAWWATTSPALICGGFGSKRAIFWRI